MQKRMEIESNSIAMAGQTILIVKRVIKMNAPLVVAIDTEKNAKETSGKYEERIGMEQLAVVKGFDAGSRANTLYTNMRFRFDVTLIM